MIRSFSVKGFKSLHDVTIDLGRVNCFIGANGSGKSNILEALGVLGAAAYGVVDDESLLRRGVRAGVPKLYKSSFAAEETPRHITLKATRREASYSVSLLNPLDAPEPAWAYKTETLVAGEEHIVSTGVRVERTIDKQRGLAALKVTELERTSSSSRLMRRLQNYAIYSPNTPMLRGIAPDAQSRNPVGLSGGSLADGYKALLRQFEEPANEGEAEERLDEVLGLIDWVKEIDTTTNASSLLSGKIPRTKTLLKFTDRFMKPSRNELTAYDASEGALYILFCAVLCLSKQSPRTFAIDNLDQALNPGLLRRLAEHIPGWLAFSGRQLLFTCHNPAVLDGLDLEDDEVRLFTVNRNNKGMTTVTRFQMTPELQDLHEQYPLSRLWMMGHLTALDV